VDTEMEQTRKRNLEKSFLCQFQFCELNLFRTRKWNRQGKGIEKNISVSVPIPCTEILKDTEKEQTRKRN